MEVASALSKAFELFAREKPRYVKTIRLVVYEPSLVDLFKTSIVRAKGKNTIPDHPLVPPNNQGARYEACLLIELFWQIR